MTQFYRGKPPNGGVCKVCGITLDEDWKTYCRRHYGESPEAKNSYTKLKREHEALKIAYERLEAQRPTNGAGGVFKLDKPMLQRLIILCHPDKHANSELATKVTQFLLNLRERL